MRSTTKWFALAIAVIMLVASGSGRTRAGSITYQLVNYPAYQNGWTLSGSITTDGTIGQIASSDIESWTWTVSMNGSTYTATSTDLKTEAILAGIEATPTSLLLPPAQLGGPLTGIDLFDPGFTGPGYGSWAWVNYGFNWAYSCEVGTSANVLWNSEEVTSLPVLVAGISVPEPASVALAALAGLCGIAYRLARKRRAERQATTDRTPLAGA